MNTIRTLSVTLALSLGGMVPATFAAEQIAALPSEGQAALDVHARAAQRPARPSCRSTTSATSTRPSAASSPRRRTSRSWPTPATSPGTWAATSGCCRAGLRRASTRRCSARPCSTWPMASTRWCPGRIYQVRGFDLANISFIKGDTGWIVFDPLTAKETARAALELHQREARQAPCRRASSTRIPTCDHFGGVRGVVDEADVASGKVMLIAPEGFMEHGDRRERVRRQRDVAAHVMCSTRLLLQRNPFGHVDQAIGKNVAARQRRADRAEPAHQQGLRGDHARRCEDGVPEHARTPRRRSR